MWIGNFIGLSPVKIYEDAKELLGHVIASHHRNQSGIADQVTTKSPCVALTTLLLTNKCQGHKSQWRWREKGLIAGSGLILIEPSTQEEQVLMSGTLGGWRGNGRSAGNDHLAPERKLWGRRKKWASEYLALNPALELEQVTFFYLNFPI